MARRIRSFQILGRLVDMDLDRLRLNLSELQGRRDAIDGKISRLQESQRFETTIAAKYPVESFTLPAFGAYTRLTLDQLHHEIKELDAQISECLEEIRYHFQESKKMELVKNKEIMRELKKDKQQEQSFYDQIAESQHHRGKKQELD